MTDSLTLEVADFVVDVLTGIYSEETGKPQPLRISLSVDLAMPERFDPDTPLSASKNYMDLKFAASEALPRGGRRRISALSRASSSARSKGLTR